MFLTSHQNEKYSQKELEREAALEHSRGELEAKNKEIVLLEKQVKELEQKLQLADAKQSQEVVFYLPASHIIKLSKL